MKRFTLHAMMLVAMIAILCWGSPGISQDAPATSADSVQKWVVDRMVSWSRPGITLHPPAMETFDQGRERYELIANAAILAALKERPLFGGKYGRLRTLTLILSISMFESSYRKDVDMNLGKEGRGDGGRSWCLMQIQLGSPMWVDGSGKRVVLQQQCVEVPSGPRKCEWIPPPGSIATTPARIVMNDGGDGYEMTTDQTRGHSGQDLIADRELCFRAGIRQLRRSMGACKNLPTLDRLSAYASGSCDKGREASRRRMGAAVRWMSERPPPMNDAQLVQVFTTP